MKGPEIISKLKNQNTRHLFSKLYGNKETVIQSQIERYVALVNKFTQDFPEFPDMQIFNTPGRTEVGGNHTDHNAGRVLAAAIDLDITAVVSISSDNMIVIHSEGYPEIVVNANETGIVDNEKYTSAALVRGVIARLKQLGYKTGGFRACMDGKVPKGSGLSSSAAFEVIIVTILSRLFNNNSIDNKINAQIAQYAENEYFGKPCGLMDQTACAFGGLVFIDFKEFENPIIEKINYNFNEEGYSIVIVDTGGNHSDMTDDYYQLEDEMKSVARALGGTVLREKSKQEVIENISSLREKVNDRAILRAFHFFDDDNRVIQQVNALKKNDLNAFLFLITESGNSSWMLCQNYYSSKHIEEQGISIGITLTKEIIDKQGAWRVHGGGFAGTIQAFVKNNRILEYTSKMKVVFGQNSCHEIFIRSYGTMEIIL